MTQHVHEQDRLAWFNHDRFGMFIHWGLYAIPARGEWVRNREKLSIQDYQPYFDDFDPDLYNPKEWAKLAKEAGMKYAVMTAKHHDGFCLFDSELTDYKATHTKANRDLIREYVDAFRAEGLKVGLYYSIIDWHHSDYPAYHDRIHPMRGNEAFKDADHQFDRYISYMHGQVKELLTNYGAIDVLWFDFSYDDMKGEKWKATELVSMIRQLQPQILIDNRLGGNVLAAEPESYAGDFASPEQILPPKGIVNELGQPVPWEACITLNQNWGYHAHDHDYKSTKTVVRGLVECVSKNGNLLLNVGPDARGAIPEPSQAILRDVGAWMKRNSRSVYGCGAASLDKPEWGRYTQRGNKLYAHILERGIGPTAFEGLQGRVKQARLLADGSEINISTPWNGEAFKGYLFANFPHAELPCDIDTIIEFELAEDSAKA
ncbi:alpha-L-fucosidase [Paenibacillus sp. 1001270B_150601_E10]|uniref:alpha-L-fucosidase n=1 Tax=Paenibacillus sp. 1001270B_150601_E10 TaxID=2787079 RepID=UPI00189D8E79|nr:alpha-L-fucosidase [Paenibacillus sp. 1001270B_150601_E10]